MDEQDEGGVQPVNVLVPVLESDGRLGDVSFPDVVLLAPKRLEVGCAILGGIGHNDFAGHCEGLRWRKRKTKDGQ